MVPVPAARTVTLIQRVGYEPVKLAGYVRARPGLIDELTYSELQSALVRWFKYQNVIARADLQWKRGE
jgi:hypothetical protein